MMEEWEIDLALNDPVLYDLDWRGVRLHCHPKRIDLVDATTDALRAWDVLTGKREYGLLAGELEVSGTLPTWRFAELAARVILSALMPSVPYNQIVFWQTANRDVQTKVSGNKHGQIDGLLSPEWRTEVYLRRRALYNGHFCLAHDPPRVAKWHFQQGMPRFRYYQPDPILWKGTA